MCVHTLMENENSIVVFRDETLKKKFIHMRLICKRNMEKVLDIFQRDLNAWFSRHHHA